MRQPPLHFSTLHKGARHSKTPFGSLDPDGGGIFLFESPESNNDNAEIFHRAYDTKDREEFRSKGGRSKDGGNEKAQDHKSFQEFLLRQQAQVEYKRALAEAGEKLSRFLSSAHTFKAESGRERPASAESEGFWNRHYEHIRRREGIRPSALGSATFWQSQSVPTPLFDPGHPLYAAFDVERQKIVGIACPSRSKEDLEAFLERQQQRAVEKEEAIKALQCADASRLQTRFRSSKRTPDQAAYHMEQDAGFVLGGKSKRVRLRGQSIMEFLMRQEDTLMRRQEGHVYKKRLERPASSFKKPEHNKLTVATAGKTLSADPVRVSAFGALFSGQRTGTLFSDRRIFHNAALNGMVGEDTRGGGALHLRKTLVRSESGRSVLNTGGGGHRFHDASDKVKDNNGPEVEMNGDKNKIITATRKPAILPLLKLDLGTADHGITPAHISAATSLTHTAASPLTRAVSESSQEAKSVQNNGNQVKRRTRRASITVVESDHVPTPVQLKRRGSLGFVQATNANGKEKASVEFMAVGVHGISAVDNEKLAVLAALPSQSKEVDVSSKIRARRNSIASFSGLNQPVESPFQSKGREEMVNRFL